MLNQAFENSINEVSATLLHVKELNSTFQRSEVSRLLAIAATNIETAKLYIAEAQRVYNSTDLMVAISKLTELVNNFGDTHKVMVSSSYDHDKNRFNFKVGNKSSSLSCAFVRDEKCIAEIANMITYEMTAIIDNEIINAKNAIDNPS